MPFIILVHCALIGLSPIIPVIFLDDWAVGYFNRRLVIALAKLRGVALTPAEVTLLSDMQDYGCLGGLANRAAYGMFRRAVQEAASELMIAVEIQRGVDLFTQAYYYAHLLDHVFQNQLYRPGQMQEAARVGAAIRGARKGANVSLVKRSAETAFKESRYLVSESARLALRLVRSASGRASRVLRGLLARNFALRLLFPRLMRRWKASAAEQPAIEDIEIATQKDPTFIELVTRLQTALASVPQGHFQELEDKLVGELKPKTMLK